MDDRLPTPRGFLTEFMIDLHTHTTLSDGTSSPAELLEEARHVGLKALAITDHDTLAGFDAAYPLAEKHNVELVCGIELSTQFQHPQEPKLAVHLLGYFPDRLPDDEFRGWVTSISSTRRERNLKLMEKLQSSNISISWKDFPDLDPDRVARPHFACVLVAKGYVSNFQTAFDLFLDDSIVAGIAPRLPSTQEAIKKIKANGGFASLAHPMRLRCKGLATPETIIKELVLKGLDAIEAYHANHSTEDTGHLLQIAAELNLLVTGGSDYHGRNKPEIRLGTGRGENLFLPYRLLECIKERVGRAQEKTAAETNRSMCH
jgi:3',5'-nucleoside bisphosphate phosphatase